MMTERRKKMAILAATGLLALALASTPARADHDSDLVAPLVTIIAAGALLNYGHASNHYHHYYRYRSHGFSQYRGGHYDHGYHDHGHYRKSQSSHGHYAQRRSHSSSSGGYHAPRYKH